jgi:hypothetical protein
MRTISDQAKSNMGSGYLQGALASRKRARGKHGAAER